MGDIGYCIAKVTSCLSLLPTKIFASYRFLGPSWLKHHYNTYNLKFLNERSQETGSGPCSFCLKLVQNCSFDLKNKD